MLVVDGYGVSLTVQRGQLVIRDGLGSCRRERRLTRIERAVRRIMMLADTGSVSLEAVRWLTDLGISLVQYDRAGRLLLSTPPGLDDARLRRAQALAATSDTGLAVAREVLAVKVRKQAAVLTEELNAPQVASAVTAYADQIADHTTVAGCVDAESHAANAYFGGWAGAPVAIRFAEHDRDRVPDHWRTFSSRASIADRGRSPRLAVTPINALLNYLYALAEAECRIALITLGLDPGLGIWHVDVKARDSLALDLLEVVRPDIDRYVLRLIAERHFRADDFHETRTGHCRIMPALAQELAETMPGWAKEVAPIAERIAHLLADTTARTSRSTPLTRANSRSSVRPASGRNARALPREIPINSATCRVCGVKLKEKRRQLCSACWPRTRAQLATARAGAGAAILARSRAEGLDPSNTDQARAKRAATLSARKQEQLAWDATAADKPSLDWDTDIRPALADLPLSSIVGATGLSIAACSRIRAGSLRPHARHWEALHGLAHAGGGKNTTLRSRHVTPSADPPRLQAVTPGTCSSASALMLPGVVTPTRYAPHSEAREESYGPE